MPTASLASSAASSLKRHIRWNDWALSKIPLLCTVASYLCLAHGLTSSAEAEKLFLFVYVFAVANAVFGFLVNDLGDRDDDARLEKRNTFNELGLTKGLLWLVASLVVMLVSGSIFISEPGFLPLWSLSILFALAYSLPPLRLKERGTPGIVVSTLAQCGLPVLLTFSAMGVGTPLEYALFFCLALISGGTLEVAHQRYDRMGDLQTESLTLAVRLGKDRIDGLYAGMLWLDRIVVGLVLVLCVQGCSDQWLFAGLGALLTAAYISSIFVILYRQIRGDEIDAWYGKREIELRVVHNIVPNILVPLLLLMSLTQRGPVWILITIWFVCWRLALYLS